jgi:hypothetical protein
VLRGSLARQNEYSGSDNRTDAEGDEIDRSKSPLETVLAGFIRFLEEQIKGFGDQKAGHCRNLICHSTDLLF